MAVRAIMVASLLGGCAIKPPPAEPVDPPEAWAKPSVQRDCDAECAAEPPGDAFERCVRLCEPPVFFCGTRDRNESLISGPVARGAAITIGIAGVIATGLLASGYIGPTAP